MKTILELLNSDLKKTSLMKELDELALYSKNIDPTSDEAYKLSLLAFKKINELLSL